MTQPTTVETRQWVEDYYAAPLPVVRLLGELVVAVYDYLAEEDK